MMDGMPIAGGTNATRPGALSRMVGVRFEPQEYDDLAIAAARERRTVSGLVRMIATDWLRRERPSQTAAAATTPTARTRTVGVRMTQDEHDELTRAATLDHRKLAALLRIVVIGWLGDRAAATAAQDAS